MANITFKGSPIHTSGNLPEIGTELKNATLVNQKLESKSIHDYKGNKIVLNIFPSIDTGVCAQSVRSFNEKANQLENVKVINVSKDLPFAFQRFCAAEGLENVESLSDFQNDFANHYEVTLTDSPLKGLFSRAVIVADENGKVIYTEQVPEIGQEPNYDEALSYLK